MRAGFGRQVRNYALTVACGDVPSELRPYLYGGRLVATSKPGRTEHRPLGGCTAWRRVAAGFLCLATRRAAGERFAPLQLGVAVRHGPEIFALACVADTFGLGCGEARFPECL